MNNIDLKKQLVDTLAITLNSGYDWIFDSRLWELLWIDNYNNLKYQHFTDIEKNDNFLKELDLKTLKEIFHILNTYEFSCEYENLSYDLGFLQAYLLFNKNNNE